MTVIEFFENPLAECTEWWTDENTNEVMTRCEVCGATARHTKEQLLDFRFQHSLTCVVALQARSALADSRSGDLTAEHSSGSQSAAEQVLLIKRELWELVIDSHCESVEGRADFAAAAKRLAETQQSGDQVATAELDALIAYLTEELDGREQDLESLRTLRASPQPAPLPENLPLHAPKGSAPVIASKQLWDNISALTEGVFETADALAARLSELVTVLRAGGRPDGEELAELHAALNDTRDALAEDRADVPAVDGGTGMGADRALTSGDTPRVLSDL